MTPTPIVSAPDADVEPSSSGPPTSPSDLIVRYAGVRDLTEALAAPLGPEDQTVQTMADVSPTKWHRAHTTWFFETFVLAVHQPGYRVVDEAFGFLFNSYYEAVGARHPRAERGQITRPTVAEVGGYRSAVDTSMEAILSTDISDAVDGLITLGLHHEQQHQELLLMDIKHVLAANPLRPAYLAATPRATPTPPPLRWVERPGGVIAVGHGSRGFAFDNEGPRHDVLLRPHRLADRLITNGEWLEFMADGGYERPDLWLSDGWATVANDGWIAPLYWERVGDHWHEFTLAGRHEVDPARPVVHVSHYEADAYARWANARLPTEHEWETAVADQAHVEPSFAVSAPHPRAVREDDPGPVRQALGEVWQWTSSPYVGYPGFAPAPGAVGEYNGKFMSGQMVLRGSSCATPPGHARATYRNFFPPGARWMFSGVRLARDA